jgi:hypothetical protein
VDSFGVVIESKWEAGFDEVTIASLEVHSVNEAGQARGGCFE